MKRRIAAPKNDAAGEALAETRELARLHVAEALDELANLARNAKAESVRVAAIKELLDRAHGRPAAALGDGDGKLVAILVDDGYSD